MKYEEKAPKLVHGALRVYLLGEGGSIKRVVERPNTITYSAADILATLIAGASGAGPINVMYMEFENNAGVPAAPAYGRSSNVSYYQGLSDPNDYLRIPLTITPAISSNDSDYSGNRVTFFGISSGVVGENGTTFANGSNSKVFGAALVVAPDETDSSQDILFSRTYFTAVPKETGYQIGVEWVIEFQ